MAALMPVLVAPEPPAADEVALAVHPLAERAAARLGRWWPALAG
jgi:hypothetical protein